MICFDSDYMEGAHPEILSALQKMNLEQTTGYGEDAHCRDAAQRILQLCDAPQAKVHFLCGGTQTNFTVIAAALRPHQGVLCAQSGHINVHETGAVEATGHKVLPLPSADGKLTAEQVRCACAAHWQDPTHEHMAQPAMVYISFPTETGLLYTLAELSALHDACRECGLLLYVDGARMGYGLTAQGNDVSLRDFAALCDAFSIGGTKVGALFGEALVICNQMLAKDFRYILKQRGGMLAKGWLLGVQFEQLLRDGLYFDIARQANEQAMRIREAFVRRGIRMCYDSSTNQQFPILTSEQLMKLSRDFSFSLWQQMDDAHAVVRFCTSWATTASQTDALIDAIDAM